MFSSRLGEVVLLFGSVSLVLLLLWLIGWPW
jgi:hypothetical protein